MKKLIIAIAICCSANAFAQSQVEEVDFLQSIYGKEKKTMVADFIRLEGPAKDAFWTLYDEYERKRKDLGKRRILLLNKYAANYENMDDKTTDEIIKSMADQGAQTEKLIFSYYKKMAKAAGIKPAAQFFQLEHYFLSEIRLEILDKIPFIGELK